MRSVQHAARATVLDGSVVPLPRQAWHGWLAGGIYLACAVAFAMDLTNDITWAFGVLYIPAVCTAVLYRDPRWVWWLAAITSAMVVLGWFFPAVNIGPVSLVNRSLSIAAIITSAALVRFARSMQDRLAWQAVRAEAADRVKTQILGNLSHELRTPLNAIIGFADLLMMNCRPDQVTALQHLRSAGSRLFTTIENLLDLAPAPNRVMRAEILDLAAVLRQACETARSSTIEPRVALLNGIAADTPRVIGDAWAVRRIADNLIGNAIKFTAPGGSVRVATEMADGSVCVVVEDTGPGMSPEVLGQLGEPFFQAGTGPDRPHQGLGTGLALCRKLADAMGATLEFASERGRGTTVRLRLRAG